MRLLLRVLRCCRAAAPRMISRDLGRAAHYCRALLAGSVLKPHACAPTTAQCSSSSALAPETPMAPMTAPVAVSRQRTPPGTAAKGCAVAAPIVVIASSCGCAAARVRADRGSGLGLGDGRDERRHAKHRLADERASRPIKHEDGYILEALTLTLGDRRACHRVGRLERELGFACREPLRHPVRGRGRAITARVWLRRYTTLSPCPLNFLPLTPTGPCGREGVVTKPTKAQGSGTENHIRGILYAKRAMPEAPHRSLQNIQTHVGRWTPSLSVLAPPPGLGGDPSARAHGDTSSAPQFYRPLRPRFRLPFLLFFLDPSSSSPSSWLGRPLASG
eukprot:scaffold71971_cov69-Phaeocystis_antarctica.AAC.2